MNTSIRLIVMTAAAVAACGPVPPKKDPYAGPVDLKLVLPGYKPEDCHYVKPLVEEQQQDHGPVGGMGMSPGDMVSRAAANQQPATHMDHPAVECSHHVPPPTSDSSFPGSDLGRTTVKCMNLQGCFPDTSGSPRVICTEANGVLMLCPEEAGG